MTPGWTKIPLVVILDLPKIKPTIPGGKCPQTPLGAIITWFCCFKMSLLVVTKFSPAFPWVPAQRLEIVHFLEFPDINCYSESSSWGWGCWSRVPPQKFPWIGWPFSSNLEWHSFAQCLPLPQRGQSLRGSLSLLFPLFHVDQQSLSRWPGFPQL